MSDELIEQLADRLVSAFWTGNPPIPTELAVLMASTKNVDTDLPIDVAWRQVARECLRQMEWARRNGFALAMRSEGMGEEWDSCGCDVREYGKHAADCWQVAPITLAPPDWQP